MKHSEIAPTRVTLLAKQGGSCALCGETIGARPVLDHDHSNGNIRQVLHAGCNSLLGKVENNYRRFGVTNLFAFLRGAIDYIQRHKLHPSGVIHPTHKPTGTKRAKKP